jgi:dolichyl-diphosphooligosaccharide---protein glycosyltransferase
VLVFSFDELRMDYGRPGGFDRARNVEIGVSRVWPWSRTMWECWSVTACDPVVVVQHKGFELDVLDEAFTSEHWIVRIYKVKKPSNMIPTVNAPSQHPSRRRRANGV